MLRLVLDTNVWLDWLVFDDPAVAPVKAAVAEGRAAVFIDDAVEAELVRALAYPYGTRSLDAQAQADAVAQCLRVATRGQGQKDKGKGEREKGQGAELQFTAQGPVAEKHSLPKCSDPDDQKFLELALDCGAAFLLTRDKALLDLARNKARPLPYRIVTPAQLGTALSAK